MPLPEKLENLRHTPFLLLLPDEADLEALAKIFKPQKFAAGDELPESVFYFLVEGSVSVMVAEEKLCTKQEGAFFSSKVLDVTEASKADKKSGSQPKWMREAMTRRVGETAGKVLIVPGAALAAFTARNEACATAVRSMQWDSLEASLNKVPFIREACLDEAQLRTLGELFTYQAEEKGQTVVTQGSTADDFFIVIDGSVDVSRNVNRLIRTMSNRKDEAEARAEADVRPATLEPAVAEKAPGLRVRLG